MNSSDTSIAVKVMAWITLTVFSLHPAPVSAEPTTPLGQWFCSVLNEDFEPATALKTFPLEQMPAFKQSRKEGSNGSIHVKLESEGLDFTVEYTYAYKVDDVNSKYGYDLTVYDREGISLSSRDAMKWLMEFGTPERSNLLGFQFPGNSGQSLSGPPFKFRMSDTGYVSVSAHWFHEKDIRRARAICESATPVSADAVFPNDPTKGPSRDPSSDPVSRWYCSVISEDFDIQKSAGSFPLEKLPAAVERRDVSDEATVVTWTAEGVDHTVKYVYSYNNSSVDEHFGIGLYVSGNTDIDEAMAWLRGFGTPESDVIGYFVGSKSRLFQGGPPSFQFSVWNAGAVRSAQWFHREDADRAAELCPK